MEAQDPNGVKGSRARESPPLCPNATGVDDQILNRRLEAQGIEPQRVQFDALLQSSIVSAIEERVYVSILREIVSEKV
ncbi:MAG: hypothetical protein KGH62_01495 [Candidatus Micrarchaeota archaeon]|nr:hypothetical protein [Candidatus Micrarchaeota archaeon]